MILQHFRIIVDNDTQKYIHQLNSFIISKNGVAIIGKLDTIATKTEYI